MCDCRKRSSKYAGRRERVLRPSAQDKSQSSRYSNDGLHGEKLDGEKRVPPLFSDEKKGTSSKMRLA